MTRIAVAAFTGWNDAGEASSLAVEHLLTLGPSRPVGAVDAEKYVDLQINRPTISTAQDGRRRLEWPDTVLRLLTLPDGRELVTVLGPEPSVHWKSFCDEILEQLQMLDVSTVLSIGSLLADAPHSRPLPVTVRREPDPESVVEEPGLYVGPIGIPTVLARRTASAGVHTLSIWAQVPHYLGQNACPKAALAILRAIAEQTGASLDLEAVERDAEQWQEGVDELARTDEDVADYVRRLEEAQDTAELPQASGDEIAREFEQFLRGRGDQD